MLFRFIAQVAVCMDAMQKYVLFILLCLRPTDYSLESTIELTRQGAKVEGKPVRLDLVAAVENLWI